MKPVRYRMMQALALLGIGVALVGCDRTVAVRGAVLDVGQRALPGVAVVARGTEYDAVTDALGHYEIRCAPGPIVLECIKTGYTPGRLEFMSSNTGSQGLRLQFVQAVDVVLWPLPPGKGVYVFDRAQSRYQETTAVQAKPFLIKEGQEGAVFGVQVAPELKITTDKPFLTSHKLPGYDVKLDKLKEVDAALPATIAAPAFNERVWVRDTNIPMGAVPIDESSQVLIELRPIAPLAPGRYAVHWGALDGHTATEARVYLFEILPPDAPAP